MGGARRRLAAIGLAALVSSMVVGTAQGDDGLDGLLGDPGRSYPDLVPNVTDVSIYTEVQYDPETETFFDGPRKLAFDTYSENHGVAALELTADDPQNIAASTVSQCISWRADHVCREQVRVGGFAWHEEHTHFHYQDFADYELRRLTRHGTVDYSTRGLVAVSEKVSFCLMDSTAARDDASPVRYYNVCNPARQGISAGYADVYTSDLEGQQFDVSGITDGKYALIVTMDPANSLFESNDGNNRVVVTLQVANGATEVSIVGRAWPAPKRRR